MSLPFIGEVKIVSFGFAPRGWAFCNGQLLPIDQNPALFSILGTFYGGDGSTNFALPNLQGRTPIHVGGGFTLGQSGGEESHTLITSEMPMHTHIAVASSNSANQPSPAGAFWAHGSTLAYSPSATTPLAPQAMGNAGGNQPHLNLSPYLVVNFVIALQGIYPSRT